jgi:hypothetical protein
MDCYWPARKSEASWLAEKLNGSGEQNAGSEADTLKIKIWTKRIVKDENSALGAGSRRDEKTWLYLAYRQTLGVDGMIFAVRYVLLGKLHGEVLEKLFAGETMIFVRQSM